MVLMKMLLFENSVLLLLPCSALQEALNDFMAMGRPAWKHVRSELQRLLSGKSSIFIQCVGFRDFFVFCLFIFSPDCYGGLQGDFSYCMVISRWKY